MIRSASPPPSSRTTILAIDDDQTVRISYKLLLEDLDYQVLEADNGLAGLALIEQHRPDLCLLDLRMPGLGGLETLQRIRELAPLMPLIVISGTGKVSDVVSALHLGAWDFLLKPIEDLQVLQHRIEKALERQRLEQENAAYQRTLEEQVANRTKELQRANQKLAASEQKYRSIFESLQDIYFETELDGTVLEVSPSIAITGYQPEELLGSSSPAFYQNPAERKVLLELLHHTGKVSDYEVSLRNKQGQVLPFSLSARLLPPNGTGKVRICGTLRDIALRKQDEIRLRDINQTLQALFDAAPLAILAVDTDLKIRLWNPVAEQMFGWRREEVLGQPYPLAPDDQQEEAFSNLRQALTGHHFSGHEVVRRCKDGQLLEVSASTAALTDSQGQVNGLILILEDISEKRRLRVEADQTSRLAALGELAAGVAHEINNPNGLILLSLPTLREFVTDALALLTRSGAAQTATTLGGLTPQRAAESLPRLLNDLEDGSRRIKQIVEDLKNFSRQRRADEGEPFSLNSSLQNSLRLAGSHLKKATNHLQLQLQPDLPDIFGSPQRIEQVIINLLLNACDALSDPGQAITISSSFDPASQQVRLCIADQGAGIAPEHLQHITDPFFTTRRQAGGTGLGLSVSARIIKEHGGQLNFKSQPGQGTSVCIHLPGAEVNRR